MNATLVAHYGRKPPELNALIQGVQSRLAARLGAAFERYDAAQVHGTIIGLEGRRAGGAILSERTGEPETAIALPRVAEIAAGGGDPLLRVRVGGFGPDDAPFQSRGETPFVRSFLIRDGLATVMGWPIERDGFPPTLDAMRRAFAAAGVVHKYHRSPDAFDNDFYFVLGRVAAAVSAEEVAVVHAEIRTLLQGQPAEFTVSAGDLSVVAYHETSLPLGTSRRFALAEIAAQPGRLIELYAEGRPASGESAPPESRASLDS